MKQELRINGVLIKTPPSPDGFSISRYNLTKAGRVANGKMTMDLVAKKRKFFFKYPVLSGTELNHILSLIDTDKLFFELTYIENNITKKATVYVGEIPSDLFRTDGPWYWTNVEFNLIEQ